MSETNKDKVKPHWSALLVAMTRASHLFLDEDPKILQDNFAIRFCGIDEKALLLAELDKAYLEMGRGTTPELFAPSYRAFVVMRQRYVEDELEKDLFHGISQLVVLGAGLDSFALRRRDLKDQLNIFEVDLPSTQQWKRSLINDLGIPIPDNLTFVPIDFEKDYLLDKLDEYGFKKNLPTFFSWLGVTVYLTEEAIFETLRQIASTEPGSKIIFEYSLVDSLLSEHERHVFNEGKKRDREPFISQFDPVDLAKRLREIGFTEVFDFGWEESKEVYFKNRADQLSISTMSKQEVNTLNVCHLMNAKVGT